jgi:hypothetical protein
MAAQKPAGRALYACHGAFDIMQQDIIYLIKEDNYDDNKLYYNQQR